MKLKRPVNKEGNLIKYKIKIFIHFYFLRYRQEAYLYKNKIFLFGGGGVSGISYSLEHVIIRYSENIIYRIILLVTCI